MMRSEFAMVTASTFTVVGPSAVATAPIAAPRFPARKSSTAAFMAVRRALVSVISVSSSGVTSGPAAGRATTAARSDARALAIRRIEPSRNAEVTAPAGTPASTGGAAIVTVPGRLVEVPSGRRIVRETTPDASRPVAGST